MPFIIAAHRDPMTSQNFDARYQLLKCVAVDDGIRTHNALEVVTGRVVMVHLLDAAGPDEVDALQRQLGRLAQMDRARVLEIATLPAGFAVVTEFLQGMISFPQWLSAREMPEPPDSSEAASGSLWRVRAPMEGAAADVAPLDAALAPPVAPPAAPTLTPPDAFLVSFGHAPTQEVSTARMETVAPPPVAVPPVVAPPVVPPVAPISAPEPPPAAGEFTRVFGSMAPAAPNAPRPGPPPVVPPTLPPATPAPVTPTLIVPVESYQARDTPLPEAKGGLPPLAPIAVVVPPPAPIAAVVPPPPAPAPAAPPQPAIGEFTAMFQGHLPVPPSAPPPRAADVASPFVVNAPSAAAPPALVPPPGPPAFAPLMPPPISPLAPVARQAPLPTPSPIIPAFPPTRSADPPPAQSRIGGLPGSPSPLGASPIGASPPPSPLDAVRAEPLRPAPPASGLGPGLPAPSSSPVGASPLGMPLPPAMSAPVFPGGGVGSALSPLGSVRATPVSKGGMYTEMIERAATPSPAAPVESKPVAEASVKKSSMPLGLILVLNAVLILTLLLISYFVFRPSRPAAAPSGTGATADSTSGDSAGSGARASGTPAMPKVPTVTKPTAPELPKLP